MPNTNAHKTLKAGIESNMDALVELQDQKEYAIKAGEIDDFYDRIDKRDDALAKREEYVIRKIAESDAPLRTAYVKQFNEIRKERRLLEDIDDRIHVQDRQANKVIKDTNLRASFLIRQSNRIIEGLTRPLSAISRSKRAV